MFPYYMCHFCAEWEKKETSGALYRYGYYCSNCAEKGKNPTLWRVIKAAYIDAKWLKKIRTGQK